MQYERNISLKEKPNLTELLVGLIASLVLLGTALVLGTVAKGWAVTASVVIPSILLEVIIGAAASIPLGFDPLSGALVATLGNMAPAPLLLTSYHIIIQKWTWLRNKLKKAETIGDKYGKYGVWILAPLAPFVGVYVGVAIGVVLRFRPSSTLASLCLGVIIAALITTYGGDGVKVYLVN